MEITPEQLTSRARALFTALPKCNFSEATFKELGNAVALGYSFETLSKPLKVSLFALVMNYTQECETLDTAEAVADFTSDQSEGPPEASGMEDTDPATPADDSSEGESSDSNPSEGDPPPAAPAPGPEENPEEAATT